MNKIYNSISMILNTATLIWGRSLCRVWVSSLLTVLLKMIFHILTGATWAIRLPWSEISFIIHSSTCRSKPLWFFFLWNKSLWFVFDRIHFHCMDKNYWIVLLRNKKFRMKSSPQKEDLLKIYSNSDEFVSSLEEIWRNVTLHYLLTKGSSAVNGCRESESPNSL